MKKSINNPKVFISYAWGDDAYQKKVMALAGALVGDGVEVLLDKWSLQEGNDTYSFMEKAVNDESVSNVLILLDPIYEKRANAREGGVGTETQIISPEIYNNVDQTKFLPIILEKGTDGSIPTPSFLEGILSFDLSSEESYDLEYKKLVKKLYGVEICKKPDLGKRPGWVDDQIDVIEPKQITKYNEIKKTKEELKKPGPASTPIRTGTKGSTGQLTVAGGIEGGGTGTTPRDKRKRWLIVIVIAFIASVMVLIFVINNIGDQPDPGPGTSTGTYTEEAEGKRAVKEFNVEKAEPDIHQGAFVDETETIDGWEYTDISTDTYSIETNESGVYGITASDLHNDSKMYLDIVDSVGSKMDLGMGTQSIGNDYGHCFRADEVEDVEAKVGEKYSINVKGSEKTPYVLYLWKPKKVVDIVDIDSSDYLIHDSMQFPGQENRYSIVTNETGTFVFKLEDLTEGSYMEMSVFARNNADNRYKEELDSLDYDSDTEDELYVDLKEGEKYFVYIKNSTSSDKIFEYPYTLSVAIVRRSDFK